jgi:uncharacterized protein YjiS (DUF1127 family)
MAPPLPCSVGADGIALPGGPNWRRKMTSLSQSTPQPAIPSLSGGLTRRLGIWAHALADYLERRSAIKTLRQLDDRALRDIGIARCHIEAAVGGAFNPDMGWLRLEAPGSRGSRRHVAEAEEVRRAA